MLINGGGVKLSIPLNEVLIRNISYLWGGELQTSIYFYIKVRRMGL